MDSTCDGLRKTNTVKATRMSYIHSTSKDFHRTIIFVIKKDNSGTVITHAACQYYFEDVEHNIEVAPHERSKNNKPFYRTLESTKDRESTKDSIKENMMIKISRCVCETRNMPPAATKSKKAIFRSKSRSQGH